MDEFTTFVRKVLGEDCIIVPDRTNTSIFVDGTPLRDLAAMRELWQEETNGQGDVLIRRTDVDGIFHAVPVKIISVKGE